jgi:hypothetical protein
MKRPRTSPRARPVQRHDRPWPRRTGRSRNSLPAVPLRPVLCRKVSHFSDLEWCEGRSSPISFRLVEGRLGPNLGPRSDLTPARGPGADWFHSQPKASAMPRITPTQAVTTISQLFPHTGQGPADWVYVFGRKRERPQRNNQSRLGVRPGVVQCHACFHRRQLLRRYLVLTCRRVQNDAMPGRAPWACNLFISSERS